MNQNIKFCMIFGNTNLKLTRVLKNKGNDMAKRVSFKVLCFQPNSL